MAKTAAILMAVWLAGAGLVAQQKPAAPPQHPQVPAGVACATCHAAEAADVAAGVHGVLGAAACQSCHGDTAQPKAVQDPASPVFALQVPKTCGNCHTQELQQYSHSIHGEALSQDGLISSATCTSCHGFHKILPSSNAASPTARANIPDTCGNCHAGLKEKYLAGIHGKALLAGDAKAPVCDTCHSPHQAGDVHLASWQEAQVKRCGSCHKEGLATYRDTFHAQVSALGYEASAHCWDCHGQHTILPASDPQSTVAPANLIKTCGRCHAGANASFVEYQPHADPTLRRRFPVPYYTRLFMNLLLLLVLGFFLLHTLLWFVRSAWEGRTRRGE